MKRGFYRVKITFLSLAEAVFIDLINFLLSIFKILFILYFSTASQRPDHGTIPSQVAAHLGTRKVRRALGRGRIQMRTPPLLCSQVRYHKATLSPPMIKYRGNVF
jgi:hypothetical protein